MKGERTFEITVNWWNEIAEITKKLDFKKILVEAFVFIELTHQEIYDLVSGFEHLGFKEIKVAYVENNPDHKTMNEFGLAIAKVSGIDGAIFTDREKAIAWLKQITKP